MDISDLRAQHASFTQTYETLLNESTADPANAGEERDLLARIAAKLAEVQSLLDGAAGENAETPDTAAPDDGGQQRKQGRINRLKDMRAAMADLMSSLKAAR